MALTKFNFNSFDLTTVASTGLAFNSSANGFDTAAAGAMTLIATNTISSGVSSSDFTSGIDSTYDNYMFKLINIHVANDGSEFRMNFRDGGSSFDATKTSTCFQASHQESGGSNNFAYETGFDLANGTADQPIVSNIGNDNKVFVLENSIAVFADFAFVSGSLSTIPNALFWFGQITNQTLNAIMIPSHIPIPIAVCFGTPEPILRVIAS